MKTLVKLFFAMILCLPLNLQAQSKAVAGDWKMEIQSEEGISIVVKASIKDDGTYTIDFGNDGQVEINGEYRLKGDHMVIKDVSGTLACTTGQGIYKYTVSATSLTMEKVKDDCENRGGPSGKMTMTKI